MPPLSGECPPGLKVPVAPVLALRLEPDRLEFGFGAINLSGQASLEARFRSCPSLQLTLEFPQSGKTSTCTVCLVGGYTGKPLMSPDWLAREEASSRKAHSPLRAFSFDVLEPFEFSGIAYDPLASIAASVARLAATDAGWVGDVSSRSADRLGKPADRLGKPADRLGKPADRPGKPNDSLMALWAAVETDLYRFAKDPGFTAAVDGAATERPEEYRRFARLNDLYRDIVELLVPYGIPPRRWTAWLRGHEYRPLLPARLALRTEEFLAGRSVQPEEGMNSLARLLARHGALLLKPSP